MKKSFSSPTLRVVNVRTDAQLMAASSDAPQGITASRTTGYTTAGFDTWD